MKQCRYIIFSNLHRTVSLSLPCAQSGEHLPSEAPYQVTRISGEIIFDGIPDEAAWESIEALPLTMYRPAFGEAPTEKSIIKIAYDDEYFYASARLFYQNPEQIRAIGKKETICLLHPTGSGLPWIHFTIRKMHLFLASIPTAPAMMVQLKMIY
jgi:hypothetical protein